MIFQRSSNEYYELTDTIETVRLSLRFPVMDDYSQWASLRNQSRAFLVPWEASWPADDLSRSAFAHRLKYYRANVRKDEAYPLLMFKADGSNKLVGGITISNVRRGIAQTAQLGYWVGQPFANQGYMSEAVRAVGDFCFGQLGLNRLEAACLLNNKPSACVLEKCGFSREGIARQYLKINGVWQDHILFAVLKDDYRAEPD
ncbi:MAG TPA: N-acetyltransferase [Rhizobiales bacterium]|nr:N-acetyltransferase [Hyphomicrobiales bacterium]